MPSIALHVNGRIYSGWKEAAVTRSVDAVAGRFDLSTMDRWEASAQPWTIYPGDECKLMIDGQAIITGYVDRASPMYDHGSHGIRISGRDKTADLVDCSAIVKSSEIRGLKLEGIAEALAKPFGLKVKTQVNTGPAFPVFAIQPGESAWEAIERAARQRFMVVTTNGEGDLVIADIGTTKAADKLVEGMNIKAARADYDYSHRFSEYIVKGQAAATADGNQAAKNSVQSKATDPAIKRYRPKIITAEMQSSEGSAKDRARLEAAARAGKSTKISVTVQGWTMSSGELWPLNGLVTIDSPMLSADDVELLISEVTFNVSDDSGITTELGLTKPEAYLLGQEKAKKGKKPKKKKKKSEGDSPIDWELPGY